MALDPSNINNLEQLALKGLRLCLSGDVDRLDVRRQPHDVQCTYDRLDPSQAQP